jgi:serine/threonine protein kinase
MNVTQVTSQMLQFDHLKCGRCNTVLPISAIFCGKCGMRVDKDETHGSDTSLSDQSDIAARYRITSLVRRRPAIQLSFAFDMQLQRLIALRDIDVSGLDEAARKLAYVELQQEYDLLRGQHITDVTPLIASHWSEGHFYSVAGWPFPLHRKEAAISTIRSPRPYTLHDLLQSGIGLPKEQIAISWIRGLALAVERLHEGQIIIGELDPDTVIMSSHDYSGQPALMVSWIPTTVRHALSQTPNTAQPSSFRAPETLYGQEDKVTDIYSLGALLYLLLTGTAPDPMGLSNAKLYRLRSPRDLNPHISSTLDAVVMQALALEPDKRFQHASELGEALHHLQKRPPTFRRPHITFPRPPKSTPKPVEETPVSSDMDNNESSVSKEAQHIEEPNDETIQIRDIEIQLARRYLSRINTGPLSPQEKQTGEATVDEVYIQEKQTDDTVEDKHLLDQAVEEIAVNKDQKIEKSKKRSSRKSRAINEHTPEATNNAEVQDEIVQVAISSAQVVEVPAESLNKVPSQEVAVNISTEEVLLIVPSSESIAEMQTPSDLVEPEHSIEEEVALEQEVVEPEAEVIVEEEQIEVEQKVVEPEAEMIVEEEQIEAEQKVVEPEAGVVVEEEQIEAEQKVVEPEAEVIVEEEQIKAEAEEVVEEEQIEAEAEEVVEEEQIEAEQELIQPEEEVIQQEEDHQPNVFQEEHVVQTSHALLPQPTSRSGMLPAIVPGISKQRALTRIKDLFISARSLLTHQIQPSEAEVDKDASFLQRVQRFILGEQKHTTMAAALIETPMRIQPTQSYAIRIQIIGRDQLTDETQTGGLSALADGDIVHIEVRLALYQNYAYMVQQADVAIPASGYAAEVTVPMHPLSSGPSSRRERLHIFFMDQERNPLYEKPFVIELFVSPLVQLGHEGHNVLSIPM